MQSGQYEVVKCVVVGDSGVGKTCLVRALACNAKYDLEELVKTHVATVWAIDHYQNDEEVLHRSWCDVDGVTVSLRLWDTFGYHDKRREFSYKGADVIVVCFSTVRPLSLKNVRRVWYPEIRRDCPTTPIILVGTRTDLRYLYNNDEYLQIPKGLLYNPIEEKDVITPEVGREMGKDIGAPYYETSVLTHHGIKDVFLNVSRTALIERRKLKFWQTQLRNVQKPLIQKPMPIPRPCLQHLIISTTTYNTDLEQLLYQQAESDVFFSLHNTMIKAHQIYLAATCPIFEELFSLDVFKQIPYGKLKRHSLHDLKNSFPGKSDTSTEDKLIDSATNDDIVNNDINIQIITSYKHSVIYSVQLQQCHQHLLSEESDLQIVIKLHNDITVSAFQSFLEYLYTGQVKCSGDLKEFKRTAELFNMTDLIIMISNMQSNEEYLNQKLIQNFYDQRKEKLKELALDKEMMTDIAFQVDDGIVYCHKVLLMARCPMMNAMFNSDFRESVADMIQFPGANKETFTAFIVYLYTDNLPNMSEVDCIHLLSLANQMCLQRLIDLIENYMIMELTKLDKDGEDILEDILTLLEPVQLHRGYHLSKWCLIYLANHYKEIHHKYYKSFKLLQKDNQEFIEKHRWPPVWYLKEMEHYEKVLQASSGHQTHQQNYNRWPHCSSPCSCFT